MDSRKFVVVLVIVAISGYFWYQRGLVTRDHEVCLGATQELMRLETGDVKYDGAEHIQNYIDAYNSWYGYCRQSRFVQRNAWAYDDIPENGESQDAE